MKQKGVLYLDFSTKPKTSHYVRKSFPSLYNMRNQNFWSGAFKYSLFHVCCFDSGPREVLKGQALALHSNDFVTWVQTFSPQDSKSQVVELVP